MGVDGAQGVHAVAGEGEEGAGGVSAARVRLVDFGLYAGPSQRHRGRRTGDAAADDEGLAFLARGVAHAAFLPGPKAFHRRSVIAQIENARTPRFMGRTRVLWKAAKRHPSSRFTATSVWIESRSGDDFVLPRITVPPVAWTRATPELGNFMLSIRPVRRVPFMNLSKSRWCEEEISPSLYVRPVEGHVIGVLGEPGAVGPAVAPGPVFEKLFEELVYGPLVCGVASGLVVVASDCHAVEGSSPSE